MARRLHYVEVQNWKGARRIVFPVREGVTQLVGANGAGKSSALDAIMGTLAGARHIEAKPLTEGELRGHVVLDLGDIIVERRLTDANAERGGTLTVRAKDGTKWGQRELDALFGDFSFDPLAVARLKPAELIDVLQGLAGEEFVSELAAIDRELAEATETRAALNRELKRFGTQPDPGPEPKVVPVAEIMAEMDALRAWNDAQASREAAINRQKITHEAAEEHLKRAAKRVAELEAALEDARGEVIRTSERAEAEAERLEALPRPEPTRSEEEARSRLAESSASAKAHETWVAARNRWEEWSAKTRAANTAERRVDELRDKRVKFCRTAKLPIDGLAWTDGGVTFNGIPLEQISSSERLRICTRLGMAQHPDLRLMLIREGSLLDERSFLELAELAEAEGWEILMEVVGHEHDGPGAVIEIREGCSVEPFEKGKVF